MAFSSTSGFTVTPNSSANVPASLGFLLVQIILSSITFTKLSTNSGFSFAKEVFTIKVDWGYPFSFLKISFHVSFKLHITFKSGFLASKPVNAGSGTIPVVNLLVASKGTKSLASLE